MEIQVRLMQKQKYKTRMTIKDIVSDAEGTVRVYSTIEQAKLRVKYISSFNGSMFEQKIYRIKNVVINVDSYIDSSTWEKCKSAFENAINNKKITDYPLALQTTSLYLDKGDSDFVEFKIKPYGEITWSSSNTNVATVTNGKVVAVGGGTCTINATYKNKTYKCSVTVYDDSDF